MTRTSFLFMLTFAAIAGSPAIASAALFCVEVPGMQPQCIYDDAAECHTRAFQLGGVCGLNPKEGVATPGYGRFCLVYSSRVSECVYSDRNSCEAEAFRNNNSVCVENAKLGEQPNPYRYVPNRPY